MRLAALLVLIAAHPSFADGDSDDDKAAEARAADAAGRAHYRAHDYAAAIDDYRRANDALPDPLFVFDMAQAYRQLHDCAHAGELYRKYLEDRPDADNREKVERFIADMDACTPVAATEAPTPPPPPPPVGESSSRTFQFMGIGTGVLGLFLVGAGAYFSIDAGHDQDQIEAACAHGCRGADIQALDLAGHAANRNAAITYSLGGAALAAGGVMILWSLLGGSSDHAPAIAPTAGGAIITGQARF